MPLHFRFTAPPLHEKEVRAPWCRGIARRVRDDVNGIRETIHTFERRRTSVHGHIAAECTLIPLVVLGGQVLTVVTQRDPLLAPFVALDEDPLNISFTMFPVMKARFAGRSASRRMRYGYHCVPKGTYTRIR